MDNRTFLGLACGLACLGVAQIIVLSGRGVRSESRTNPTYISVDSGQVIESQVARNRGSKPVRVADLGAGACTYVVVYSRTCSASLNAARTWSQAARRGALGDPGSTWRIAWIADDEGDGSSSSLPDGFPAETYEAVNDGQLLSEIGVGAWPVFVSLDHYGRVVSKGVGAGLPSELRFGDDCSIAFQTR